MGREAKGGRVGRPWVRRLVFAACLALALAHGGARGEEVEVSGSGAASPTRPPDTTDPPDSWDDEAGAHDPEEGVVFAGPAHWELQEGASPSDSQRWADTDHIHWTAHGATLRAEGQVQDSDPESATIATAEAWGKHKIAVTVLGEEGAWGQIRGRNRVGFEYAYTISGGKIAEASVQLSGSAFDLNGREHTFSLNDQRAESVTDEHEDETGIEDTASAEISASAGNTPQGGNSRVRAQVSRSRSESSRVRARVVRRLGHAGGDTGRTESFEISHEVSGSTPLFHTYEVFSDGVASLRARAGEEGSTVVVKLSGFRILNSLRAFKDSGAHPDPASPSDPPEPGGPTTPPEVPYPPPEPGPTTPPEQPVDPPGSGGEEHDGGCDAGGGGDEDGPIDPSGDDGTGWDPHPAPSARVPWFDGEDDRWMRPSLLTPFGLSRERGSLPGAATLQLDAPAGEDLVFTVEASPAGVLDLPRAVARVAAGGRATVLPFHALEEGEAELRFTLVDEHGAPTATEVVLPVRTRSTAAFAAPRIWIDVPGKSWWPGRDLATHVLPGETVALRLGRLGFAGLDDEATVVRVAVADPDGVLAALPSQVVLEPGEIVTPLAIATTGVAGRAAVQVQAGDDVRTLTVVARAQSWSTVPRVRVPLGAAAAVPVRLERPARRRREVAVQAAAPSVAGADPVFEIRPGEPAWVTFVEGRALGTTRLTLTSDGLPPLEVDVEVVAATITVEGGLLTIDPLPAGAAGGIDLWVEGDAVLTGLEPAPEWTDALVVDGRGTPWVRLDVLASPDLPERLTLPVAFAGSEPVRFVWVMSALEEEEVRVSWRLPVR